MKKLLTLVVLCAINVSALAAGERGFYASAGGGVYHLDSNGFSDTAPTIKLLAGFDFNRVFAVEAAYLDLFDTTDSVFGDRVEVGGDVWELSTKFSYPLAERLSGYGRLGWSFYDLSADFLFLNELVTRKEDGDDVTLGLGANYALTPRLGLRGEIARIFIDDGDADFVSVNIAYRFGRM